ncbi:glycosyltransferase family 4 protein [Lyngbya confervoides]|uniref:Glycosyltransferase family 4 protein n=1 Tax=Lyngbya confervoides BDU141951 TaxID=1574623 RepID=A0ABD4SZX4_9CYAN|nr:glycosyltransferase family 4 protein [Lyngbya confervoides]MCM1981748.1 glycosyltransferase family 4 protein [Lyngbya confervoides BDU141951]
MTSKLAIVTSHPIQYYAPWFRFLAQDCQRDLRVFYLWDFGVVAQRDRQFQTTLAWDIPLLEGYPYEFVENVSAQPGTSHFWGLNNPSLAHRLRAYQPDAVLCMVYNYISLYRLIFTWRECPLLFRGDSHRLVPPTGVKAKVKQWWIRQIFQRFAACLYVGQANYRYYLEHGVHRDRLFFSPHSIDNQRFSQALPEATAAAREWKRSLGIPSDHRVILFAGKFISKKRPQDLLQAFLEASFSHVSLLFVGAGPLEAVLRSQASGSTQVYFAPFQNQSQMPRTLAIADVVVLPSYGAGETWGLIVNEAMCLGKPVIVSHHVGCAEDLVKHGQNGYIFPAGDVASLTQILIQALGQADLDQMGRRSSHHIQAYSYERMAQGLGEALASLPQSAPALNSLAIHS